MDTCHYCGQQYHPMPVYTRPGDRQGQQRIHVCHVRFRWDEHDRPYYEDWFGCRRQAEADGYVYRPDLTPSR